MLFRLSKNTVSLITVGLIDKLAGVLFFAIIARKLTQAEFGAYSLTLTLLFLGGMLANFGLEFVIVREVARERDRAKTLFNNSLLITIAFSLLAWPFIVGLTYLLSYPPEVTSLISFAGIGLIFMGVGQTATAILKAYERMELFAFIGSLQSITGLGLGIGVLWWGGGVTALVLVLIVTEGIKAILLTFIVHHYFTPLTWQSNQEIIILILKQAIPFALLMAYGVLIRRIDLLILGWLRPLDEVAVYGVATKFTDFLSLFSGSMVGALYPTFSAKLVGPRQEAKRLYDDSIGVFAILGCGAAFAVMVLAEPLIKLLSGDTYLIGTTTLRWLGWAFLFNVLSGPVGVVLLAAGDRMRHLLAMCIIVVISNILLNLWLIPLYSYNGAAVAMLVSTFLGFLGRLILAHTYFGQWPNLLKIAWRPLIAGLGMALLLGMIKELNIFVVVAVGGLTYASILVVLGELRQTRYEPFERRLIVARDKFLKSRLS